MQPGYSGQPQQIDNNMTMSIVAIFLFWPLAIPAIINASKVNGLAAAGDFAGAQAAAAESKKWSKWALIVGLAWYGVVLLCCVLGGLGSLFSIGTSASRASRSSSAAAIRRSGRPKASRTAGWISPSTPISTPPARKRAVRPG